MAHPAKWWRIRDDANDANDVNDVNNGKPGIVGTDLSAPDRIEACKQASQTKLDIACLLCPQACLISDGAMGLCGVRFAKEGKLWTNAWGVGTHPVADPVEKKPLHHFLPGTGVLSFGLAGCNLACSFCQNWQLITSYACDACLTVGKVCLQASNGQDLQANPDLERLTFSKLNCSGAPERHFKVLALDLPTGLDPSSGDVTGPVIRADVTACFGHLKRCHGLRPAKDLCGEISLVPIPLNKEPKCVLSVLCGQRLAADKWNVNKYEHGHIAIRAGTKGMSGAAVLAANGALRGGAGLVTVLPDADVVDVIASQIPEAMVMPWEGALPAKIDVLLVGPGGVKDIPKWDGPLVLDASALHEGDGLKWMKRPQTIQTPHSGEFSRLFGLESPRSTQERLEAVERINRDLLEELADEFDEPAGVLVLKGAQTLITGGGSRHVYVNPTGHPGLATGGTGDFLAGLVAARYAKHLDTPLLAATQAVWLHGAAADRIGQGPLLVSDLGTATAMVFRDLYNA